MTTLPQDGSDQPQAPDPADPTLNAPVADSTLRPPRPERFNSWARPAGAYLAQPSSPGADRQATRRVPVTLTVVAAALALIVILPLIVIVGLVFLGEQVSKIEASAAASAGIPAAFASGFPHEDPGLESLLPASVAGRQVTRWSVKGADFFSTGGPLDATAVARINSELAPAGLTIDDVSQATAGRSSLDDPPYFVLAIRFRGQPADSLPMTIGIGPNASSGWVPMTVGSKDVQRGTTAMISADVHVRGIPYVYNYGDVRFLVVSDDAAWVRDALGQLP